MTNTLTTLDASGDTRLTWDPADPDDREAARRMVADLKAKGYQFFLLDGSPADEVQAGQGGLVARRLTPEEVAPPEEPAAVTAAPEAPPARRRGRPRKAEKAGGRAVVAVRPLAGG